VATKRKKEKIILDIGCGFFPLHLENTIHADIERISEHLEIICDAYRLPFRKNTFWLIHASNILEHLGNPQNALREFKRVADCCFLKVPFKRKTESGKEHIISWTPETFFNLLNTVFNQVKVQTKYRYAGLRRSKLATLKMLLLSGLIREKDIIGFCSKKRN